MKRYIMLALVAVLCLCVMTGCCLKHDWEDATCEDPQTCAECGKTKGEPLGHEWEDATCTDPKTCSRCDETKGQPLGHSWVNATCTTPKTCSTCSATEGTALGHSVNKWKADGSQMSGHCNTCNQDVTQAMDWELFGNSTIVDKWSGVSIRSNGKDTSMRSGDSYLTFTEDGKVEIYLVGKYYNGTWSFVKRDESTDMDKIQFKINHGSAVYQVYIYDDLPDYVFMVISNMIVTYKR